MRWVWTGIFVLLTLACVAGVGVTLWAVWMTGDLFFLAPAAALAVNAVYSGLCLRESWDED